MRPAGRMLATALRDPLTKKRRTSQRPLSAEEVAAFPEAKRIKGTKTTGSRTKSHRRQSLRFSAAARLMSLLCVYQQGTNG